MSNKNRFMLFLGGAGVAILLTAFVLTISGAIDYTILNYTTLPKPIEGLISFSLFYINTWVMQAFAGRESITKPFITTVICFILAIFIPAEYGLLITVIIPTLIIINLNNKYPKFIYFSSIYWIWTLTFQAIFSVVKIKVFNFNCLSLNAISYLILSADLFLFYIFLMKGVKPFYEQTTQKRMVGLVPRLPWIFSKENSFQPIRQTDPKNYSLTPKQEAVKRLIQFIYFSFQLIVILALGRLNNLLAEMVILIIIFIAGRAILGNAWHSDKLSICFVVSTIGFYATNKITIPFKFSLFLTLAIAGLFTYTMYIIGNKADRLEELETKYNEDFTKYGLTKYKAEFAFEYKIKGWTIKQQAEAHGISEKVVSKYRTEINHAINNGTG